MKLDSSPSARSFQYGGIDLLRHLLALAVVIEHSYNSQRYSVELQHAVAGFCDYIDGAVMGFFIVSGFLAKEPAGFSAASWLRHLLVSARRLLVPFFLFSIAYSIAMALLHKGTLVSGLWQTLILAGSSMQLYFLPFLFYTATAFYTIAALSNETRLGAVRALPVVLAMLLIYTETHITASSTGNDFHLLPLYGAVFIAGFLLARVHRSGKAAFYLASFALVICAAGAGFFDKRFFDVALVTGLLALAIFVSAAPGMDRMFPGSGGVYLLHVPVALYAISIFLSALGMHGCANLVGSILLTYVVCLVATVLFCSRFKQLSFLLLER